LNRGGKKKKEPSFWYLQPHRGKRKKKAIVARGKEKNLGNVHEKEGKGKGKPRSLPSAREGKEKRGEEVARLSFQRRGVAEAPTKISESKEGGKKGQCRRRKKRERGKTASYYFIGKDQKGKGERDAQQMLVSRKTERGRGKETNWKKTRKKMCGWFRKDFTPGEKKKKKKKRRNGR